MRLFSPSRHSLYIAFNKPFAVLSQFTVPEDSNKATLAQFGFPPDTYPVGRLDFDSEGLLLLSDDGSLNQTLLHPSRMHRRTYWAQVENVPTPNQLQQLEAGVLIQGHLTSPAQAVLLETEPDIPPRPEPIRYRKNIPTAWIQLTLTEGKNRQVRRMTAAVGLPTLRLLRVAIGNLNMLELNLQPGAWRELNHQELLKSLE